jgi:hypothetical protein
MSSEILRQQAGLQARKQAFEKGYTEEFKKTHPEK